MISVSYLFEIDTSHFTAEEKRQYREEAKKAHPDTGGSADAYKEHEDKWNAFAYDKKVNSQRKTSNTNQQHDNANFGYGKTYSHGNDPGAATGGSQQKSSTNQQQDKKSNYKYRADENDKSKFSQYKAKPSEKPKSNFGNWFADTKRTFTQGNKYTANDYARDYNAKKSAGESLSDMPHPDAMFAKEAANKTRINTERVANTASGQNKFFTNVFKK